MNRTFRSLVLLAVGAGLWACKGDPQSSLNRGDINRLVANPGQVFVAEGATVRVVFEAKDNLNQSNVLSNFAVATTGSAITVRQDTAFNRVFDASGNLVPNPAPTRLRYEVTGNTPTGTSFNFSANGLSLDVPVFVLPVAIPAGNVSNTAPALGEDITITLHGSLAFEDTVVNDPAMWGSLVAFDAPAPSPIIKAVTANSVTLEAGPNTASPATLSHVTTPYSPQNPPFSLATTDSVISPAITQVPVTVSNSSPAGATLITITLGTGFQLSPTARVTVGVPGTVTEQDMYVDVGGNTGTAVTVAAPSNTNGGINIYGAVASAAPAFNLDLPTDATLSSGACFNGGNGLAGTDDPATAPVIAVPAVSGDSVAVYDCGPMWLNGNSFFGFPGRWYDIDTDTGPASYAVDMRWNNSEDYGWYIDFGGAGDCTADAHGGGAGNSPENASGCTAGVGTVAGPNITFSAGADIGLIRYLVIAE